MTNSMYINSEELNQFRNQLQALFDDNDTRNAIMNNVEKQQRISLIPYLNDNSTKIYLCDFEVKRRIGIYIIDKVMIKGKYNISIFSFSLDAENNIFITSVLYDKKINNKIDIQLQIESDEYRNKITDLIKKDNNSFKAESVVFRILFENDIFAVLSNNELSYINDYHPNSLNKFSKSKNIVELGELLKCLNEYEPITAFQILENKNVTLSHEKLELYHLEFDQKLDFKKSEKNLKEIFAQVGDIVISKNMNNNQKLIKYEK